MSSPLNELVKQLDDPSSETRLLAIKRLGMMYDPQVVKPLMNKLLDSEAKVREATILSLGALGEASTVVNPIVNCLDDEEESVVLAAIKVLGELRSIRATKPLIKLLTEKNPKIRVSVIIALGQIEDKNALFPLIDSLEDEDINVKIHTILALGQIGDLRAVEPIIEQLKEGPAVQQVAALTLGKFEDPRIIAPLKDLLSSNDAKTRQCAIVSLGALKNPQIIEPLLQLLNDSDSNVRRAAATALSEIKDNTTVEHFILRLKDPSDDIRVTAARALGKLRDQSANNALIDCLKDKAPEVKEEAIIALGELKNIESSKALGKLLKDNVASVRAAAASAIAKIEGSQGQGEKFSEKLRKSLSMLPLSKALKDPELVVRAKAAEALAKIHVNQHAWKKAASYYEIASKESLTWDFHQDFFNACALGCKILERIENSQFNNYQKDLHEIFDLLKNSARMISTEGFVSENFWKATEIFLKMFSSANKDQFIQFFKDLGIQFMVLTKKLPDDLRTLLDTVQENLNSKFQVIQKRGLPLAESLQEVASVKEEILEAANKIFQIEPLEFKAEQDSEATIDIIENLIAPSALDNSEPLEFLQSSNFTTRMPSTMNYTKERKFLLNEVEIGTSQNVGDLIQIALIQMLKGVKRLSLVEEPREIWARNVKRYYDYDIFENQHVLQFTPESVQMRAKPKIIGFLDDTIYEGTTLAIFPELSVPFDYIDKLKQFAERYNVFIIAGVEAIGEKNKYYNRAYVISPFEETTPYQQKNSATILLPTDTILSEWREGIETTTPPVFEIFYSPFGKFTILLGRDIIEYLQYVPYITKEKELDFVVLLNNGHHSPDTLERFQNIAEEIQKPLFYVNTGQFGGTSVITPDRKIISGEIDLKREFTEGILHWNYKVPPKEEQK